MIHVSAHAIERFQERVENLPADEVRQRLVTPAVELAARIGAPFVKLGSGQRIVLRDNTVVTVLAEDHRPGALDRRKG